MHFNFNFVLTSFSLFTSAVLAGPSDTFCSPPIQEVDGTSNWNGAFLSASSPTFHTITGTFEVPYIQYQSGSALGSTVGVMIGIDGSAGSQCNTSFVAGVSCYFVVPNETSCTAVAEWAPNPAKTFSRVPVSPGDLVRFAVIVLPSQTAGYVTVENSLARKNETIEFSAQPPLCRTSAEWFITNMADYTLGDFSAVVFSNAMAYGDSGPSFTPNESTIYTAQNGGRPVASVTTGWSLVVVEHV